MSGPAFAAAPRRLLDQLRNRISVKHDAIRNEKVHVDWARRYIIYHGRKHSADLGAKDVEAFLSHLEVTRTIPASTQNQAKAALLTMDKEVLEIDLPWLGEIVQAKATRRLPLVLTTRETKSWLDAPNGTMRSAPFLLDGSGLQVLEPLRLRVEDAEFERTKS